MGSDISNIMTLNKFHILNKFLHLADNKLQGENKTDKFKNFYSILKRNWNKVFKPGQYLTLDEGIAAFQGRSEFKQYMPAKPEKWGLKVYLLADSNTDYILSAKLYRGKSEATSNYTVKLVINILENFMWKGHIVFMDSFYCCPILTRHLYFKDTYVTGMTRGHRLGMPKEILKDLNLEKNELKTFSVDYFHLDAFKDKKKLLLIITSAYSNEIKTSISLKPESLVKYNEYMNSVDKANQKNSYYRFPHKNRKWWKVMFFELLEISISNSYIIYKNDGNKLSHKEYRLEIATSLIKNYKTKESLNYILLDSKKQHYIGYIPQKLKRLCKYCKQSKTIWMCQHCTKKKKVVLLVFV